MGDELVGLDENRVPAPAPANTSTTIAAIPAKAVRSVIKGAAPAAPVKGSDRSGVSRVRRRHATAERKNCRSSAYAGDPCGRSAPNGRVRLEETAEGRAGVCGEVEER
jgi:hypothetical protein